jgi:DNA-binding response OmpR family regulator
MRAFVVDGDVSTAERLVGCLQLLGFQPRVVGTGGEALHAFRGHDLVLLNLNLPDIDGHRVCRSIRAAGDTPVIALATGGEGARVLGLRAGADDCLDTTFGTTELVARIQAVMRRMRRSATEEDVLVRGQLRIEPRVCRALVSGRPIPLTRKELALLSLLASEPERVFTREELMARIWQDGDAVNRRGARASRTLDTHVNTLRNKIGNESWIATVRGVGFRFAAPTGSPAPA